MELTLQIESHRHPELGENVRGALEAIVKSCHINKDWQPEARGSR